MSEQNQAMVRMTILFPASDATKINFKIEESMENVGSNDDSTCPKNETKPTAQNESIPTVQNECNSKKENTFISILRNAAHNLSEGIQMIGAVEAGWQYIDVQDFVEGLMDGFLATEALANFYNLIQQVKGVNTLAGIGDRTREDLKKELENLYNKVIANLKEEEAAERERELEELARKIIDDPRFKESMLSAIKGALRVVAEI